MPRARGGRIDRWVVSYLLGFETHRFAPVPSGPEAGVICRVCGNGSDHRVHTKEGDEEADR